MPTATEQTARLATLGQLLETTFAAHLSPVPSREAARDWLDQARIPRLKANPRAKRGGGVVYYQVCAVERMLRGRLLPGRIR